MNDRDAGTHGTFADDQLAADLGPLGQGVATSVGMATAPTIRKLAELEPATLALMHGPTFFGDGAAALMALADYFEDKVPVAA